VDWVSKSGSDFEKKLAEKQTGDVRFNFLKPGNMYYAYYQQLLRLKKSEEVIDDSVAMEKAAEEKIKLKKVLLGELPEDQMPKPKIKKQTNNNNSNNNKKEAYDGPIEKPQPEMWVIEKPVPLLALQDDVIKLSAQFVARNGRVFQNGLMNREQKNPLFGFLQPYHPHHQYFKKLVQSYTKCLLPEKGTLEKLLATSKDKQGIIKKLMQRVYYERAQRKSDEQKKKEEDAERSAMAMIDWHEFVVVQTIEYEDDDDTVPPEQETVTNKKQPPPPKTNANNNVPIQIITEPDDMSVEDVEEEYTSNLKVRSDYVPRSQLPNYVPQPDDIKFKTASGQSVPVDHIKEHIKAKLIDPNVIEKKKKKWKRKINTKLTGKKEMKLVKI